jgi:hypothetical protein
MTSFGDFDRGVDDWAISGFRWVVAAAMVAVFTAD